MARFDPLAIRERLLANDLDDYLEVAGRTRALAPIHIATWGPILPCVIECFLVGLAEEPRCTELLDLVLDRLAPERWVTHWSDPRSVRRGEVAWAWATLAIARWLETGEQQTELFANAIDREYFEQHVGHAGTWRMDAVDRLTVRMCAGEHFTEVLELFQRPQLAAMRARLPAAAASAAELAHAFAQHVIEKRYSSDDLADAAERTLGRTLAPLVENKRLQSLAELLYFTSMQIGGGDDARTAFARLPAYL